MKDGGWAFPLFEANHVDTDYDLTNPGMTLRDYFAGQALRCVQAKDMDISNKKERKEYAEAIAIVAYEFADAMLAEREKQ